MVLPKTPKQCAIKIRSLKKQLTEMEKRKKKLAVAAKKPAKKKAVKRKVAKKKVAKKKVSRKKRR
jgi:adenylate kinase